MKSQTGFSEVVLSMGLGMGFAICQVTSGHLSHVCAQIMTATGLQISALWFYVHRVHMLQKLKNHPDGVILEYWQQMYAMHIEP